MRFIASALLLLPAPLHAQSAGQWGKPERIWTASCTYCHDQGVGPSLRGTHPDTRLVASAVRNGMPGMPVFHRSEIDDQELAALSAWLQRQPGPAKAAAPPKREQDR